MITSKQAANRLVCAIRGHDFAGGILHIGHGSFFACKRCNRLYYNDKQRKCKVIEWK